MNTIYVIPPATTQDHIMQFGEGWCPLSKMLFLGFCDVSSNADFSSNQLRFWTEIISVEILRLNSFSIAVGSVYK